MLSKRDAEKVARDLVAALGGKRAGWTPRVSENLGWHGSAISKCGRWYVTPYLPSVTRDETDPVRDAVLREKRLVPVSYTCFLGNPFSYSGVWAESARTPLAAVHATRVAALTGLQKRAALLDMKVVDDSRNK